MYPPGLFPPSLYPPSMYPGNLLLLSGGQGSGSPMSTPRYPSIYIPGFLAALYFGEAPGPPPGVAIPAFQWLTITGRLAAAPPLPVPYFEGDLLTFLRRGSNLTVYPGHIPQKAKLPALVVFQVSATHGHKLSGGAGFVEGQFQISVFSRDYTECTSISEELRLVLQGYRGAMGASQVYTVIAGPQLSRYDEPVSETDAGTHSKINEFEFHYQESVPYSNPPPDANYVPSYFSPSYFAPSYFARANI